MANPLENLTTRSIPAKYAFLQNMQIGLDVIMIVTWVAAALVYAYTLGRKRVPILLLSTYAGLAIGSVVAKLNLASVVESFQNSEFFPLFIFLIATILAFVSVIRIIRSRGRAFGAKNGLLVVSVLEMGAFVSTVGSFLPPEIKNQISGFAGLLFTTPWTQALWLIVPLIIFLISEHRERKASREE